MKDEHSQDIARFGVAVDHNGSLIEPATNSTCIRMSDEFAEQRAQCPGGSSQPVPATARPAHQSIFIGNLSGDSCSAPICLGSPLPD